ncbi:SapC family protein [Cellvibrio sp. NN19]|uniref:SapC family protein n=1 Tax=Cellvibrio chitinivorans TaxID=3102792 RepID=UPI002B416E1D|nr:SapC family protein [Cellvibrio sp. NN19]
MPNFALLNNVAHKNMRVIRENGLRYGDSDMSVVTFPQEFRAIQNEYPIFFQKNNETGKFIPIALTGLRQNENLFLSDKGWDAQYIPASIKRRPFLIGVQPPKPGEGEQASRMVYVDMDSPRISETQGEPVFLPHGGYSPYLESMVDLLEYIQYGTDLNEQFIQALLANELLEIVTLEITLKNGEQNNLAGMYTINEEKLAALSGAAIAELHNKGFVEYIYMVLASHSNMIKLIARVEERIAG